MANEVKIVLSAVDNASATIKGMGRNMTGSFTELLSAASLASRAFAIVQDGLKATVGETITYAKQVRDLSRLIGATPEESSKLIQVADDVMISYQTLSTAMKAAIRKGVEPTVDGIGKLADEYRRIQDPIARSKFLMDKFGRAGADLGPLMELGAAGIRELGKAAEESRLVMSKDAVDAAREYEKSLDQLQDRVMGLKIAIGSNLIPALNDWLDPKRVDKMLQAGFHRRCR